MRDTLGPAVPVEVYTELMLRVECREYLERAARCRRAGLREAAAWQLRHAGVTRRYLAQYRAELAAAGWRRGRGRSNRWYPPATRGFVEREMYRAYLAR